MTRRRDRFDREASGTERAGHDRKPELALVGDVVAVGVRAENVSRGQVVLLREGMERLERRAGVDENGGPARLVAHEIGVREPAGVEAACDEHHRKLHPAR